jgi:hypothetical protein
MLAEIHIGDGDKLGEVGRELFGLVERFGPKDEAFKAEVRLLFGDDE